MSNSTRNVTCPLQSTLNMNKNQSLTTSSYDIFNNLNAPVFGGCISPLHYKYDSVGDAKYSRDGTKWSVANNVLYKDGVAFKDFSGTRTFDVKDTGLDLDGIIANGNEYIGVKVKTNSVEVYRIDANFAITYTQVVATFTDYVFRGFKLAERDGTIYLLIGSETSLQFSYTPELLQVFTFNGSDFVQKSYLGFSFCTPETNTNWSKLGNHIGDDVASNWFFTLGKQMLNNQIGVSVFKSRPNAVNTFKSIWYASIVMAHDGTGAEQIQLMSGPNLNPRIAIDTGNVGTVDNRNMQAFFVDNSNVVMAVGHVPDTREYSWVKMMSYCPFISQDGTYDSCPRYYPYGGQLPGETTMFYSAILTENGQDQFAEIKGVGSSSLCVNSNGYARLVIAGFGRVSSDDDVGSTAPCVNNIFDAQNVIQGTRTGQNYVEAFGLMNAGVTSNASIPTTEDGWRAWWKNRKFNDNTCWNPAGARFNLGSGFYALYNGKEGNLAGISYSQDSNKVGTLLTAWGSPVQTFEPTTSGDKLLYKDSNSNTVKCITRKVGITLNDIEVVAHYVLIRCVADENIYDTLQKKWAKFANDWNNRMFFGYSNIQKRDLLMQPLENQTYTYMKYSATVQYKESWSTSGAVAAGYDVAYQKEKGFAPSRLFAYTSLSGIVLGQVNAYGYELTSENGLDVFASSGTSSPSYRNTLFGNGSSSCVSNLAGSTYPITSSGSAYFNIPIIESEIVNSYNGKYGLKIGNTVYTIAYDGVRPIALYNTASIVDTVDEFFIVQSQYYAVINGYIAALSYSSSNTISGVDQIVDVTGMKFIGAFPSCAYFYSPAARSIYAFTGDADLQLFCNTDRITEVYNSQYFPQNEWIVLGTNDGAYLMTQNNTFRLRNFGRVKRMFGTDDEYVVLVLDDADNSNVYLSLSKLEGFDTLPIELETAFFGEGDMKTSTIDEWYIRVFKGDEDYNGKIKCTGKTLTNIVKDNTTVVEELLTKEKFDANDNAFITYRPEFNRALGQSFKIVSDYPIAYLGFRIGGDGATNKSKFNI